MPHYTIGLFLEAAVNQIPMDDFEALPRGKLADREPPVFYWRHLDTGGTAAGQKKVFQGLQAAQGDTDSGWEETSESSGAEYEEESTFAKVESESADSEPTFFTLPQLSTSAHLTTFTSVIPPFGQRHAPVGITSPTVAEVIPQAVTETDVPQTVAEALPTTVANVISVALAEPVSQADVVPVAVSQIVELPAPESEPQIRMEVIDCDAVVNVSSLLVGSSRASTDSPINPAGREHGARAVRATAGDG